VAMESSVCCCITTCMTLEVSEECIGTEGPTSRAKARLDACFRSNIVLGWFDPEDEAVCFSETSDAFQRNSRTYFQQDSNLNINISFVHYKTAHFWLIEEEAL
jgi:hypothetical protein